MLWQKIAGVIRVYHQPKLHAQFCFRANPSVLQGPHLSESRFIPAKWVAWLGLIPGSSSKCYGFIDRCFPLIRPAIKPLFLGRGSYCRGGWLISHNIVFQIFVQKQKNRPNFAGFFWLKKKGTSLVHICKEGTGLFANNVPTFKNHQKNPGRKKHDFKPFFKATPAKRGIRLRRRANQCHMDGCLRKLISKNGYDLNHHIIWAAFKTLWHSIILIGLLGSLHWLIIIPI